MAIVSMALAPRTCPLQKFLMGFVASAIRNQVGSSRFRYTIGRSRNLSRSVLGELDFSFRIDIDRELGE